MDRIGVRAPFLAAAVVIAGSQPASAQAPGPPPRPASASPSLEAARVAFEALPEAERKAIQEGLIWTGNYNAAADGTFGRQTLEAIVAFQRSVKEAPTGILSESGRKNLKAATQRAKSAAGFTVVKDPVAGVQIGVPAKVLPKQDTNPNGGSRWQSADLKVTLDTRLGPPDTTLQTLYERNLAIQTPGRAVGYKLLRPDFFVISGETPTGRFYTRYASGPPGIRGFSIGYDKTLGADLDRLVVAIASSFVPFPEPAAATAAANPPQPLPTPQAPRLVGTGLVIGPHEVATTARVDECKTIRVRGLAAQRVEGKGPHVLKVAEDLKAQPLAMTEGGMEDGASVLVVAFAEEDGIPRLTATSALATGSASFVAPLQPGASGAPVLDSGGRILGIVRPFAGDARKIAGILPSAAYRMTSAADLARASPDVRTAEKTPAHQASTGDIVASIREFVVPILCER